LIAGGFKTFLIRLILGDILVMNNSSLQR